jgi:hypothetical protein
LSSSWSRRLGLLLLLASSAALAQEYAGTWVARHPGGGSVTLTLQQQGPGEVIGKLEGSGASFDVDAEVRADGFVGMVSGPEAMVYVSGRLAGPDALQLLLVEPGADGQPNMQSARQINFTRKAPTSANERRERLSVRPGGQGPG